MSASFVQHVERRRADKRPENLRAKDDVLTPESVV
jgi:hypothetical protein